MPAPDANSRKLCYKARDKYYECRDKNPDKTEVCEEFRKMFEKSCLPSWVKHFDRKRVYEEYKKKLNTEGFKSTDE